MMIKLINYLIELKILQLIALLKKHWIEKNYNPIILKKFSKEIQDLIEDLPKNEVDNFIEYLQNADNKINFPTNSTGNLFKTLAKTGVPDEVVSKIIYHTSQDEGKRGVGMGEVGMSLLFKNVGSSTSGKGDLSIDGEEFEIKRYTCYIRRETI